MSKWDVIVIGGGPAGLSAAADIAQAGLSCLVIDRNGGGGEPMNLGALEDVEDHPDGPSVAGQWLADAVTAGAETAMAEVTALTPDRSQWRIATDDAVHEARAVILATGLAPGTFGIENEVSFEGLGLSHCATCDGPLYRGEPVAVAGSGRWAVADARELAAMGCLVTFIPESASIQADGATTLAGRVVALEGTDGLDAIHVQPPGNAEPVRIATRALFVQTNRRGALDFAPASLDRDEAGRVRTDDALNCGMPGLYAAGDARAGAEYSIAQAIQDGKRAAAAVRSAIASLGNAG